MFDHLFTDAQRRGRFRQRLAAACDPFGASAQTGVFALRSIHLRRATSAREGEWTWKSLPS
jgi:hypothetical protein